MRVLKINRVPNKRGINPKKVEHGKYIAYECYDCGEINIYPKQLDGVGCISCNGRIIPIGAASIYKNKKKYSNVYPRGL